ncbi:MAG TPA: pyruvate, phosphate dikinase [Baekduia sp.]|uniref:pyruvate, phosphate dikinase n=1 Tax=Baekduia sp. TaxID=2600305 RepID=UPI002BC7903A|nr:pyruvate, phosphate dikinase [Baekduia sp.]HMJ33782.1 pyruvate, phosphate dikinase [Baekduia sp.]
MGSADGTSDKWVYEFAEGSREMRDLLGGKGANVAEMTRVLGADRVPAGFTITTEACVAYMNAEQAFPEGLDEQVATALARLEEHAGKALGDSDDPLLVSVRSGARESMPGMLDTVLNLGLNDESVEGLARKTRNERFAWDSYRRFVQMYGNVVVGIEGERFEDAIKAAKKERGVRDDTELDVDALRELTQTFKGFYEFPADPQEQLQGAIRAVFDSWVGDRAVSYRRINHIPDEWGTAVNIQQMVFGNKGDTSGSGVAFSRDEVTGEPEPSGDFLPNAQGEDVVSGVRTPRDIRELKDWQPEVHKQLMDILRTLEQHYGDMQDTEFTVEESRLYMLQTRNAKRPAQAAVRFAVDAVGEGLLDKGAALATIEAEKLDALLHPTFDPGAEFNVLAKGVAASPGAAKGEIVFLADDAVAAAADGRDVVLVRPFTEAEDVAGFHAAKGVLTSEGGKASHAALVARGMGVPAVTGAGSLEIDVKAGEVRLDGQVVLREGELVAIDGTTGCITTDDVPLIDPEMSAEFRTVLGWADELRRLDVRTNADTPEDARKAREFGAQGIGLCRTEHMFFGEDRHEKMVNVILASDDEQRRAALDELLGPQQSDFEGIFEAMDGLPVTIRLLDPPLHEFLPKLHDVEAQVERARVERSDDLGRLEHTFERVRALQEVNPMLGTRGVRLGILYPAIYEMQIEAIFRALVAARGRDVDVHVEVMVPLVDYRRELALLRELIERVAGRHSLTRGEDYSIGTMIELPRACLRADEIAHEADFYSFGTNDLTQTALGFSRDDIEGRILARYIEMRVFDRSPFETLDGPGVGQLVRMGAWLGRKTKPELKLGVCGEHGGDPDSIDFFHHSGMDYVSCSPYRVPVARVAAAQAAVRNVDPDLATR